MATVSLDPAIRVRLTQEVKDLLGKDAASKDIVEVSELKELKQILDERKTKVHFHELLSKCEVILPTPDYAPRNPELEARVQKLKAEQENREYDRMVDNVNSAKTSLLSDIDEPISKQLKDLNRYLVLIAQFVVSMVSAFAFGYLAPYYFAGTSAVGPRLLSGIIAGFVVGIADLYFVVRFLLETEGVLNLEKSESVRNQEGSVKSKIKRKAKVKQQ